MWNGDDKMKRFSALILCLLFVPLAVSAETVSDSFYVGTWVLTQPLNGGNGITVTYLELTEDHQAYFSLLTIHNDGSEDFNRSGVKTWTASGDKVLVRIGENAKLYLKVKDQNTLQDDQYRPQDLYVRVGSSPQAAAAIAESGGMITGDLCGKWSHYWDARDLNAALGSHRMNFDIRSYDLFLLDDGSAYLETVSGTGGTFSSGGALLPGSWTLSEGVITLSLGTEEYRAWLDASGRLFLRMADSMALIFEKTNNYNYEEGLL